MSHYRAQAASTCTITGAVPKQVCAEPPGSHRWRGGRARAPNELSNRRGDVGGTGPEPVSSSLRVRVRGPRSPCSHGYIGSDPSNAEAATQQPSSPALSPLSDSVGSRRHSCRCRWYVYRSLRTIRGVCGNIGNSNGNGTGPTVTTRPSNEEWNVAPVRLDRLDQPDSTVVPVLGLWRANDGEPNIRRPWRLGKDQRLERRE
jgi:hypothetical protein